MDLLATCATINLTPNKQAELESQASQMSEATWQDFSTQVEKQGLSALVYAHFKKAAVTPPQAIKRELQGLFLRHQHACRVRQQVLLEILTTFNQAGIRPLLLKGAALAYLVYPQPHLRPMRDIDILVDEASAREAQRLLTTIGFKAPLPPDTAPLPDKHLDSATRQLQGMKISVEIHHNLFNVYYPLSMTTADLTAEPLPFTIEGVSAYALGYEDMLWHLCQHVSYHAKVPEPIRWIWIADIVGFANRFALQIDWQRVQTDYPLILKTLSLFHFVSPLSDTLLRHAPIKIGQAPQGIGQEFIGWPRFTIRQQRKKSRYHLLKDSFLPSEWWLRLHYEMDSVQPLWWYRWIRHPMYLANCVWRLWNNK